MFFQPDLVEARQAQRFRRAGHVGNFVAACRSRHGCVTIAVGNPAKAGLDAVDAAPDACSLDVLQEAHQQHGGGACGKLQKQGLADQTLGLLDRRFAVGSGKRRQFVEPLGDVLALAVDCIVDGVEFLVRRAGFNQSLQVGHHEFGEQVEILRKPVGKLGTTDHGGEGCDGCQLLPEGAATFLEGLEAFRLDGLLILVHDGIHRG